MSVPAGTVNLPQSYRIRRILRIPGLDWRVTIAALAASTLILQGCGGSSAYDAASPDGGLPTSTGGAPGMGGTGAAIDADIGPAGSGGSAGAGVTGGSGGGAGAPVDASGAGGVPDANIGAGGTGGPTGSGGGVIAIDGGGARGGAGGQGGSSAPACGDPGSACCTGNTCSNGGCCVSNICMQPGGICVGLGGGICNAGVCGTCGGAGLPCCGASSTAGSCTAPGTSCSNGVCAKCGDLGLACCPGAGGGAASCNGTNTICNGSLCVTCGTPGSACCPGSTCAGAACCYGGSCVAENTTCGASAGTCQAGQCSACGHTGQACCPSNTCYDGLGCRDATCSSCGHAGEACCPAGGSTPVCQAGTTCSSSGASGVCARCGGLGDVCCAGNVCADGCCSAGRCLQVSGGCSAIPTNCGNGILTADETCDDGNTTGGDGCSADCSTVEPGWQCRVPGKKCTPLCGDSVLTGSETCDDGNTTNGDGCSSTCQVEPGADCPVVGEACTKSQCGNGKVESGEICDCGIDANNLPSDCKSINGLFYGDGQGCSKTCTKEPNCRDSDGHNQACTTACGDGHMDPGEECDDGNLADGDGCSSTCTKEAGFTCSTVTQSDAATCQSGSGTCLELPVIYRDFLPENATGGHPDFMFLGTQSSGQVTRWCVPNSAGPAKGSDSTARCWDLVASDLLNGKPQYNSARTDNLCACQFSDWSVTNSSEIAGGYTASESPLYDPSTGTYRADISGYTSSTGGGPVWKGMVPVVASADTFNQWFNDDASVNQTFTGIIEVPSIGTNIYQYSSKAHLMSGGFFPLDAINSGEATLCNMWPYWHKWTTCAGAQYLFPPRVVQSDCPSGTVLSNGCWVTSLTGVKHDNYFTDEVHYYFVYDGNAGINLQFYGDDDLFIFINGKLVLDLGGVHTQLPGRVTVSGSPGSATVVEGGCLDSAGNMTGITTGSTACSPTSTTAPSAKSPDDFRARTVDLGLVTGKTYEIAIFGADRHPPESNFQLTLNGYTTKRSVCTPRCGDGIVSAGEECDCGDGTVPLPAGCTGANNDATYGGCTSQCKFGPYCGDGVQNGPEACDLGKRNGDTGLGKDGCTVGCTKPPYCGDGNVDASLGEECDLGANNGQPGYACSSSCTTVK